MGQGWVLCVWEGGIWDDGVNSQRKTGGEVMDVRVVEKHGAHKSGKAADGVFLQWVRFDFVTMRIVRWESKDGKSGGL